IRPVAFFVNEVNSESVNARLEMREAIDCALLRAPVVFGSPVLDQFLEVGEIGSILPRGVGNLAGKARVLEPRAQVGEHCVGHLDAERLDFATAHWNLRGNSYSGPAPVDPRVEPSRLNASILLLRERFLGELAGGFAVKPGAELVAQRLHDWTYLRCARRNRSRNFRAHFIGRGRGGQIRLEDFGLGLVLLDQVLAGRFARKLQRFFALGALALDYLQDLGVAGFSANVFFEPRNLGQHPAQRHRAQLVAALHRGLEIVLNLTLHFSVARIYSTRPAWPRFLFAQMAIAF